MWCDGLTWATDRSSIARSSMKLQKGRVRAPWLYGPVMTHTPNLRFITYCLVTNNSWKASYVDQHVRRRATVYFSGGARGERGGKESQTEEERTVTLHILFADGREKQDAEVCSLSAFGGNGTWREGCSVPICMALCRYLLLVLHGQLFI